MTPELNNTQIQTKMVTEDNLLRIKLTHKPTGASSEAIGRHRVATWHRAAGQLDQKVAQSGWIASNLKAPTPESFFM